MTLDDSEGVLRFGDHICVPRVGDSIKVILQQSQNLRYCIHLVITITHRDLKQKY